MAQDRVGLAQLTVLPLRRAKPLLLGIRVGSVDVVDLQFNTDTHRSRVRAQFTIDMDRATEIGSKPKPLSPDRWRLAVEKGLQGGSILTGPHDERSYRTASLFFEQIAFKNRLT